MKCCAPVLNGGMIRHRSDRSSDPRCQRNGRVRIRGKWFCRQHARLWKTHYEIIDRIRAL